MTGSGYSLTGIQEGMVFHLLSSGTGGVDIEQILVDFPAPPDHAAFQHAWQAVVSANEALRLRLEEHAGQYFLAPVTGYRLPVADVTSELSGLGWEGWLQRDRATGLDPGQAVPMRLAHGPLRDGTRYVWTLHHILLDGRSFPDVLADVFGVYESLREGGTAAPRPHPDRRPFLDWLKAQEYAHSGDFWRKHLDGLATQTTLVQVPRPDAPWALQELRLSDEATRHLRDRCEALGVSLNALVQAAWAVLLGRYTDQEEVCFGAVRAGRRGGPVPDTDAMLGVFINTIPIRANLHDLTGGDLLRRLHGFHKEVRPHEHTPLTVIQQGAPKAPVPLFETLLMFDNESLEGAMHRRMPQLEEIRFTLRERPPFPATLYAYAEPRLQLRLNHREDALTPEQARSALAHLSQLLGQLVERPEERVPALEMLTDDDYGALARFNDTARQVQPTDIDQEFRQRVKRHPEQLALITGSRTLSYRELDEVVARIANGLAASGVKRGSLVGVGLERSAELVASVLAILRLGAAYLPLDPDYPGERLRHYVKDSGTAFIVATPAQRHLFEASDATILDALELAASEPTGRQPASPAPDDLAYVIYTSGSTGVPNGVMIEHRSVANFLAGMDDALGNPAPGRWIAVTSLSFDISVLELLWTLTRGFEVVIHGARDIRPGQSGIGFSLFHFAQGAHVGEENPYRLILEGARFADQAGFEAVWSPERHFHDFGAPYPNPSVISAAIAAITERVQIRAGSVVLPLHDPLRVAEEWAQVDQLSDGRVGMAIASGWQPNDFALAPGNYESRKEGMYQAIETLRALWRGEAVTRTNGLGDEVELRTFPRPRQPSLPIWITAAGNPETFAQAGRVGANVLTHMLGQSLEQIEKNLAAYREARHLAGHDEGRVTLMLHTFVGEDEEAVKALVREPMKAYLASSASLVGQYAHTWSAYRRGSSTQVGAGDIASLDEESRNDLFEFAFERFFETSSLLGCEEKCTALVESLRGVGVNEIACLVDFGVETDQVLEQLPNLQRLAERVNAETADTAAPPDLVADLKRYAPTHLQCTPSQARMLTLASEDPADFASLRHVMIGGEALPPDLCQALRARLHPQARITNMYGPTETTIWSTTAEIPPDATSVPIGTPIANTGCHVLDSQGRPAPLGRIGELFISGAGLARGYHQRPELNAQRFPVRKVCPGGEPLRLYATGDLVRLDGGALHYMGRQDFQLKVRGYRIELGEIESALREMDGVRDAALVAREDSVGAARLIAHVVPDGGAAPDRATMQAHLRQRLPDFMVPGKFVTLEALPLTPNGKVDRKALPDPEAVPPEKPAAPSRPEGSPRLEAPPASEPETPPGDGMEALVRDTWQRLLDVPAVAMEDNFFDLGGHSILAVKMQSELRRALGRRVPITDIFRYPTAGALARRLTEAQTPHQ